MAVSIDAAAEITARFGVIKRARGCYVYTQSGIRLTDMAQDGGRAVLGWGFGKSRLMLKNTVDRGFTGSCMPQTEAALSRALHMLLPSFACFRVYTSESKILRAVGPHLVLWRPWSGDAACETALPACVEVCMPFAWAPYRVFAFTASKASDAESSDAFPPPIAAAMTRAVYDLAAELPNRTEKNWCAFDAVLLQYWKRQGAYLVPLVSENAYQDFFLHCLDAHLLISSEYTVPSVVPFGASDGNFSLLKKQPFSV